MANNKRYLRGVEYNCARVIESMADMVLGLGGRVRFNNCGMEIYSRGLSRKISDLQDREYRLVDAIDNCIDPEKNEKLQKTRKKLLEKTRKDVDELKEQERAIPAIHSRFMTEHGLCERSIDFVLDNAYYHFSFSDNPFFQDNYTKIRLTDNSYEGKFYAEGLTKDGGPKPYFVDELWTPCASEDAIRYAATSVLDMLRDAKTSTQVPGYRERIEVPNVYDGGWHKEYIYKKDTTKHYIDF